MLLDLFTPPPQLPHTKIPLSVLLIVEEALRVSWNLLRTSPPANFDINTANEDDITQEFRLIVCNQVLQNEMVDGFSKELFSVNRESKYRNYKHDNSEKMPDLVVDIKRRPPVEYSSDDGLFIECKPVDVTHPTGDAYCGKGLVRFVEGSYAWTMQQAMMIGYTRTGYTILPKLHDALKARSAMHPPKRIETLQYPSPCPALSSQTALWCEAVHISCHNRTFHYDETEQPAPPITLRHLWLRRD